jgi:hypothetical protein
MIWCDSSAPVVEVRKLLVVVSSHLQIKRQSMFKYRIQTPLLQSMFKYRRIVLQVEVINKK